MSQQPDMTIRAAEPQDAPALATLLDRPGVRHGTLQLPFQPLARVAARLGPDSPWHMLVGEIDAGAGPRIVAHGGLLPGTRRRAHVGEIFLPVDDDHTGRGLGTAILRALTGLADDWLGLRRLELDVNVDNAAAIRLYARHGFEIEGTRRGDTLREGRLVDGHLMGRLRPAPPHAGG